VYFYLDDPLLVAYLSPCTCTRRVAGQHVYIVRPSPSDPNTNGQPFLPALPGTFLIFQDQSLFSTFGFPFHKACWFILQERLIPFLGEPSMILQHILRVCLSVRMHEGLSCELPVWPPDCYRLLVPNTPGPGLGIFNPREPSSLTDGPKSEDFRVSDPLDCPELRELCWYARHNGALGTPDWAMAGRVQAISGTVKDGKDPFYAFSTELRTLILEWLCLPSALNLRLASRAFASMGFSSSFWRSRFWRCNDLSMIFEAHQVPRGSGAMWKWLYIRILRMLRLPAPSGLMNRFALFQVALDVEGLVVRSINDICRGRSFRADELRCQLTRRLGLNQWNLDSRVAEVHGTLLSLVVYTAPVAGKPYITGLTLQWRSYEPGGQDIQATSLGYCSTTLSKRQLLWSRNVDPPVCGLQVACDIDGIVGIGAVVDEGRMVYWAGDDEGPVKRGMNLDFRPLYLWGYFDVSFSLSFGCELQLTYI
jgi:hypothetical protein